ncbi:MAG: type IV pilus modification protein PilV [Gammaproteobacteria bacterium]|nr:type IV pilus modification protein PilV [Gammaproteobacteria bacterium]
MRLANSSPRFTTGQLRSLGFSLLEVLIAVSILAVAMLGIAAMQLMSIKDNRDAYFRSQAVLLSQDMAERMRSNKSQISAYNGINTNTSYSDPGCSPCTPTQIVSLDKYEWSKKIKSTTNMTQLIPSAQGTVTESAGIYTISVSWQADAATASTYSIRLAI